MIVKRQLRNDSYYEPWNEHRWGIYTGNCGTLIEGEFRTRAEALLRRAALQVELHRTALQGEVEVYPKPSIGRIVHYVAYGTPKGEYPAGAHRAAIITQVHSNSVVGLCIINPTGIFFNTDVVYSDPDKTTEILGTWHWPEHMPQEGK